MLMLLLVPLMMLSMVLVVLLILLKPLLLLPVLLLVMLFGLLTRKLQMTNYIKSEVRVYDNGDKYWHLNGKLHREDGPAVEWSNGEKAWYLNGKLHREDGPAIERSNGYKAWYLNNEHLTEEEFNERMTPTVEMTMAQINEALGKNVKVVK
jgi:hypothetical protein